MGGGLAARQKLDLLDIFVDLVHVHKRIKKNMPLSKEIVYILRSQNSGVRGLVLFGVLLGLPAPVHCALCRTLVSSCRIESSSSRDRPILIERLPRSKNGERTYVVEHIGSASAYDVYDVHINARSVCEVGAAP